MCLFRRALAPLLALLLATPVMAAPALWRFGDEDTTIYLFGTIHALPPGYNWRDARLRKSSIDPSSLDRMPTWQAAFVLMGSMMKDLGIKRDAGVETNISKSFERAPTDGGAPRTVEGLETPGSQLALFADLSEADQRELLISMVSGQGDARRDYVKMLGAWANGNQLKIARAFEDDKDLTPHLREVLLRRRNENWAQWLKARLAKPGTIFVAVGAGHLAGPISVQSFLAAEGIRIQRIYAHSGHRSAAAKVPSNQRARSASRR